MDKKILNIIRNIVEENNLPAVDISKITKDTSQDWQHRWLRLGASLHCDGQFMSSTGGLIPVNSEQEWSVKGQTSD